VICAYLQGYTVICVFVMLVVMLVVFIIWTVTPPNALFKSVDPLLDGVPADNRSSLDVI
jgi:hypothetical protein